MKIKNILFRRQTLKFRGSVLIVALWAVFLLSIYAFHLGGIVRQKLALMDRLDSRDQLYFIAEAGVQRAFAVLRGKDQTLDSDALNETWSNNPAIFHNISVGSGSYDVSYVQQSSARQQILYGMTDEESKININTATVDVLTRLLISSGGLSQDRALELAYAVIDWRDEDAFFEHPQFGAEDDDYMALQNPYECKDANFEVLEELLLVKGMTQGVFNNIKNFITVYSKGSNINTVSKGVLLACGLSDGLIDKILSFRRGADSLEGTADDGVFKQSGAIVSQLSQVADLSISEVAELNNFVGVFSLSTTSDNYRVRSLARLKKNSQELEINAVVDRNGQVHYWREEYRKSADDTKKQIQF